ncbi:MAG: hypothetical protein WB998_07480 [Solirubrobacteraceae bacterium]
MMTLEQYGEPPVVWRTKLRSTLHEDHAKQVAHCVKSGLIGIGWGIESLPSRSSMAAVFHAIENNPEKGWGKSSLSIVRRFATEAEIGDFVWTRDTSGQYLLCRITGPWRYDNSKTAKAVDVHQVRRVQWAPRPLNDLDVPGGVIRCFIGVRTSFSRIADANARRVTAWLWEKLHGRPLPSLAVTPRDVLTNHLDPYDVEDLVYVWLQMIKNYAVLPKARQRDMPAYEWTMIHRRTGRPAIAQVKTGSTSVDLTQLARAAKYAPGMDTYAYATSGRYEGDRSLVTAVIQDKQLLNFANRHADLLPPRVRTWFDLARDTSGKPEVAAGDRTIDINSFMQRELRRRRLSEVQAVEAASWLQQAQLLADSKSRPGKPLRDLLRVGAIHGSDQRPNKPNGRWFIVSV